MNSNSVLGVVIVGLCVGISTEVRADETIKFRTFMHATATQSQDVGDVESHVVSVVRFSGLAELSTGDVATSFFVGTTDYTKGIGTFSDYNNITFKDGSILWYKAEGTSNVSGGQTVFKGTVRVVGGKGVYDGAKGDGSITGTRYTTLKVGADLFNEVNIILKK